MDTICIVPNVLTEDIEVEQPLRQVCLPLKFSPLCFKVYDDKDEDSDCDYDSDSDESVDVEDEDEMTFDFSEMMT